MAETEEKLVLKPEVIKKYLSHFDYTAERETMQYMHLILANKRIEQLNNSLLEAKHVTFVDLQNNNVVDINVLQQFPNVVKLNLAKNKIKNISIFNNEENFPNLKWLDISNNKYTELIGFKSPKLEYIDIGYNRLEKINESWTGHPNIKVMNSVDNRFKSLAPFKDMPKLEELYLANNSVTNINGWESLPALKKLHLRKNKIEKLGGGEEELPPLESLKYLNLRGNKIASIEQVAKLFQWNTLEDLNVLSNPVERATTSFNLLIAEILILNPKIKRFCKVQIEDTHKLEAVYLAKFRWTKSEEERLRKEEEERKKAEADAAAEQE